MGNVLEQDKQQQVLALGRLGWTLTRIGRATGVHRVSDLAVLAVTLVIVPSFFLGIFALFAPQYLEAYRRILGR
jgi:hypothetical protein